MNKVTHEILLHLWEATISFKVLFLKGAAAMFILPLMLHRSLYSVRQAMS